MRLRFTPAQPTKLRSMTTNERLIQLRGDVYFCTAIVLCALACFALMR